MIKICVQYDQGNTITMMLSVFLYQCAFTNFYEKNFPIFKKNIFKKDKSMNKKIV